jgi:hypothetical protein
LVDLSIAMLAQAPRERTLRVVADAGSVRLRRRFDILLIAGLLEFVGDPASVLENAASMASSGAVLVTLLPVDGPGGRLYRSYHRQHGLEIRLFTAEDLVGLAERAGWRTEVTREVWPYTLLARLSLGNA